MGSMGYTTNLFTQDFIASIQGIHSRICNI